MDVYLGNISSPKTGKGFFLKRLSEELSLYDDVNLIFNSNEKHDISLHISKIKKRTNAKKHIIRFDGCIINISKNYKRMNNNFRNSFNHSDGIIYQSNFCKEVCDKFISIPNCITNVISNGSNVNIINDIVPAKKKNKYVFITASRWRPQKRLKDIVETFLLADIDDSILYVAGDLRKSGVSVRWKNKYLKNVRKIKYLGILDQEQLLSYLKISDAFIHLSWIDWCPNSVVEAIAAGVPVICNNVGGTQEIVRPGGGIICDIDKEYKMIPCQLYSPPLFDRGIVVRAINKICDSNIVVKKNHIDIREIAKKYKNFFEVVMRN